jgi:hypothetical protein
MAYIVASRWAVVAEVNEDPQLGRLAHRLQFLADAVANLFAAVAASAYITSKWGSLHRTPLSLQAPL